MAVETATGTINAVDEATTEISINVEVAVKVDPIGTIETTIIPAEDKAAMVDTETIPTIDEEAEDAKVHLTGVPTAMALVTFGLGDGKGKTIEIVTAGAREVETLVQAATMTTSLTFNQSS